MTNQTTTDSNSGEFLVTTRRTFHLAAIYVLGALISLALAIPTVIYLLVPPKGRKQSAFIDAGDISQLTPGQPVELSFQQERLDGWKLETEKKTVWVVKGADNKVTRSEERRVGKEC